MNVQEYDGRRPLESKKGGKTSSHSRPAQARSVPYKFTLHMQCTIYNEWQSKAASMLKTLGKHPYDWSSHRGGLFRRWRQRSTLLARREPLRRTRPSKKRPEFLQTAKFFQSWLELKKPIGGRRFISYLRSNFPEELRLSWWIFCKSPSDT